MYITSDLLYLLSSDFVLSDLWDCFFAMLVCAFNSLPKGEYWNIYIVTVSSNKSG